MIIISVSYVFGAFYQGDVSLRTKNMLLNYIIFYYILPILWIKCVLNLFRMSEYFEKKEFEFSRFYYTFLEVILIFRTPK